MIAPRKRQYALYTVTVVLVIWAWKLRWRERDMHIDTYLFTTGRFDRLIELIEHTKP